MGASNVAKVFVHWRHLGDRDIRALVFMANMALDQAHPPVYYGGWQTLAEAMGRDCSEGSKRSVLRVLQSLAQAGAVASSRQARSGVRANYALTLDPGETFRPTGRGRDVGWVPLSRKDPRVTASDTHRVTASDTHRVTASDTHRVTASDTHRVTASDTPRNKSRNNLGIPEEQLNSQPSVTSRESSECDEENLPLTQEQELNRQTAELKKRYGPDLQGDGNGKPKPRVAGEVRRRVRGRQTAADGAGVSPG